LLAARGAGVSIVTAQSCADAFAYPTRGSGIPAGVGFLDSICAARYRVASLRVQG
jgi:hypothetical protein